MVREGKCKICGTPAVTRMLCGNIGSPRIDARGTPSTGGAEEGVATAVPNTLAANTQRPFFNFLNGC
jgi:hypothetical protein